MDKRTFVLKTNLAAGRGRIIHDPNAVYRGEVTVATPSRPRVNTPLTRIARALEARNERDYYNDMMEAQGL